MDVLHVTNGSVVVSRIHDLRLGGRVLSWDDLLHEGPVPAGMDAAALRRLRAGFLSASNAGDAAGIARSFETRDRVLEEGAASADLVLWFEHDLYDQLQVLQILDRVRDRCEGSLRAILADDYLAAQPDETLRSWFQARRALTADEWDAAAEAWRLFREPEPVGLSAFDHPGAWPALRSAVRRHLQQFPAIETGLSRTERQTLAALGAGPRTPRDLYAAANRAVEDAVFMGDFGWWLHVGPLLTAGRPLLRIDGAAHGSSDHPDWWADDDRAPKLALTADGDRVLAGELDHVAINGIDRWLGGVRLDETGPDWRWDESRGGVIRRT